MNVFVRHFQSDAASIAHNNSSMEETEWFIDSVRAKGVHDKDGVLMPLMYFQYVLDDTGCYCEIIVGKP